MAVSANDNLGGCVIQLRLYLIDIVQKNYRGGFRVTGPFSGSVLALMTHISMATIDCFSPVGLRDDEDDGGFSFTLQLALQVKLTVNQN